MNKGLTILIDVAATVVPIIAFMDKHSGFFVTISACLSIAWWVYQFIKPAIKKWKEK